MKVQNFRFFLWYGALFQTVITSMISDDEGVLFWIDRGVEAYNNGAEPPLLEVNVRIDTREKPWERLTLPVENYDLYILKEKVAQKKRFVFIIHGFLGRDSDGWLKRLSAIYLKRRDVAVFRVDWSTGSITTSYPTAVENTKLVAIQLRNFIEFMRSNGVANQTFIHLIGHSLGAHIAGFVGDGYPHINRITGLDPASLGFSSSSPRLKVGDANNVDVIHTNNVAGLYDQLGDVDFYINDGQKQPHCKDEGSYLSQSSLMPSYITEAFGWFMKNACSHKASYQYFFESIQNTGCKFVASKTPERSRRVRSRDFDPKQDTVLGLDTFKYQNRGKFYVTINNSPPFCRS